MPGNPHKWGFKMWAEYFYDFDMFQGGENPDKEKYDVGAAGDVVLEMTSNLPSGKKSQSFC